MVTALTDTKLVEEFDFDVMKKNIKDLINIFYLMVIQYFYGFFKDKVGFQREGSIQHPATPTLSY